MLSLKRLFQVTLACLPFWHFSAAEDDIHESLQRRRQAHRERLHEARNLVRSPAASSASTSISGSTSASVGSDSSSSFTYMPSWAASSTFTISVSASSSFVPAPTPANCGSEDCKFYNANTSPYFVKEWPETNFDVGESYGGSTPVCADYITMLLNELRSG